MILDSSIEIRAAVNGFLVFQVKAMDGFRDNPLVFETKESLIDYIGEHFKDPRPAKVEE